MDRNTFISYTIDNESRVALRKESVDRNILGAGSSAGGQLVALRKESVDRNLVLFRSFEMVVVVALRKESVDRNLPSLVGLAGAIWSLSARRAWIEIHCAG